LTSGRLQIISLSGQIVMERTLISNTENVIDISALQSGIYFLKAISETGQQVQKFVKK